MVLSIIDRVFLFTLGTYVSLLSSIRQHRHYVYLWQRYYGEHSSVGFRNEIISFLVPFLTHVFVHPTTLEFSLKVTLFVYSVICLFLFDFYIANGWAGITSANSVGHSAIYEICTISKSGSAYRAAN